MKLWNDYEGKTIADAYTLGHLLRPEGRSALFTLPKGVDGPAILRLTESLNDEGQMLTCWRRVSELKQDNLLPIRKFGETVFDGTPLTYCVMEAPDATLAELLKERPMTQGEAMQVASSVVPALQALHAAELVHDHIEPGNVVAVGETVKLRADCVRECKVDADLVTAEDCASMRQKDVEAFGLLLLRALTLEKKLRPGLVLPAPFDRIVPNAVNGMWGLAEIAAILPAPVVSAASPVPPVAANVTGPRAVPAPAGTVRPTNPSVAGQPATRSDFAEQKTAIVDPPLIFQRRIETTVVERRSKKPVFAAIAIAAVVLLAIMLRVFHSGAKADTGTAAAVASSPVTPSATQNDRAPVVHTATPAATVRSAAAAAQDNSQVAGVPARLQPGWYVIAYTFNHEQQALQRAEALVKRYPGLHPQVIAPHGRAFLIALGGAMSHDQAENVRNLARRAGMPRDTFVRNYGS